MTEQERRRFLSYTARNASVLTTEQLESVVAYALDCRTHPRVYGESAAVANDTAYRDALFAVLRAAHAALPDKAIEDLFRLATGLRTRK